MIAIDGLSKAYGRRQVLTGLTLSVDPGEVVLLVGANGCGKTTTLRLVAGLSAADAGHVLVNGHDVVRARTRAVTGLSFLPQSPRFHARLTVAQILAFYARLRGLDASRVEAVVARWGLEEFRSTPTGRLSGGMRQRLGLAVFDLPDAPVLVLDEPGLSLDPEWRRRLNVHLQACAANGRTVLVATHLLGEWEGQADRCLVLDAGRVAHDLPSGRLRETFPFPSTPLPAIA